MQKAATRLLSVLACLTVFSLSAFGQDVPSYELFGGIAFSSGLPAGAWLGWHVSGVKNLDRHFGIVVDIGRQTSSQSQGLNFVLLNTNTIQSTYLAGLQVASRNESKLAPSIHLLAGVAQDSAAFSILNAGDQSVESGSDKTKSFALLPGASFDYTVKEHFAIRLVQVDFMCVRSAGTWAQSVRFSTGLIVRLGKR